VILSLWKNGLWLYLVCVNDAATANDATTANDAATANDATTAAAAAAASDLTQKGKKESLSSCL
jgi:hypothetical protein